MNKNAVYVLEQPKHSIVSVILVDSSNLPLSRTAHDNIDALREVSDLVFVFSDRFGTKDVDIPKFSNLYGACSYVCGDSDNIGTPIFMSLAYCNSVFQKHHAYLITDTNKLTKVGYIKGKLGKMVETVLSGIQRPVLRIERLGPEELGSIYTIPLGLKPKKPWWNFWESPSPDGKYYDPQERLWSTHKSSSPILFFKAGIMKIMLGTYGEKEFGNYLATFSEDDLTYLFASCVKRLGLENINQDIHELEIKDEQAV